MMRILLACERSGVVRDVMRRAGHEAYSCDIDSSDSAFHLQRDVRPLLRKSWDMVIAFPPCTRLTVAGARWFRGREKEQKDAIDFFMECINANAPQVAVENPIGIMSTVYRKPDQIIQPWMFGHGETKATCLWLKGLPKLIPTKIVDGRIPRVHYESPGIINGLTRGQRRSVTYSGIAEAMLQWVE